MHNAVLHVDAVNRRGRSKGAISSIYDRCLALTSKEQFFLLMTDSLMILTACYDAYTQIFCGRH